MNDIDEVFAPIFDYGNHLRSFIFTTPHTINIKLLELFDYANERYNGDYHYIAYIAYGLLDCIIKIRADAKVYNAMIIVTIGNH